MKLYKIENDGEVPAFTKDSYEFFRYEDGTECIIARVSSGQMPLIRALVESLPGPFKFLYVLTTPGENLEAGRYESPQIDKLDALAFIDSFGNIISEDSRHHLWIADHQYAQIVYDNHERIFLYAHIEALRGFLAKLGVSEAPLEPIPSPHIHRFRPELAPKVEEILTYWPWMSSPLQDGDDD